MQDKKNRYGATPFDAVTARAIPGGPRTRPRRSIGARFVRLIRHCGTQSSRPEAAYRCTSISGTVMVVTVMTTSIIISPSAEEFDRVRLN